MFIGDVKLNNNIFLAPMAGITDVAFRALAKEYGAGLTYTEMVSAKALVYGSENTKNLLKTDEIETPKAIQLFGSEPEIFKAAVKLKELDKFDIIDINMGCPAPKIVKNGEGSMLMENFSLAKKIIEACVCSTNKPITVKFRKGIFDNDNIAAEFAKMCEQAGASAVTVHGRTRSQGYSGAADWECIKKVKESVKISVIANGDIYSYDSYKKVLDITKADAVMIGRASFGRPFIFEEILNKGKAGNIDKIALMERQIALLKKHDAYNFNELKKHFAMVIKGEKNAPAIRQQMLTATSVEECLKLLKGIYN